MVGSGQWALCWLQQAPQGSGSSRGVPLGCRKTVTALARGLPAPPPVTPPETPPLTTFVHLPLGPRCSYEELALRSCDLFKLVITVFLNSFI